MNTQSREELFQLLSKEEDIFKLARIVHVLRVEKEISILEIAKALGKHPSYVSHVMRILKIPQLAVDGYYSGQISMTHLMIISRLQTESQMKDAYEEVLEKGLTVPQTEQLIRQLKFDVSSDENLLSPKSLKKISIVVQDRLEARVRILQSRVRAKIVIEKRGNTQDTSDFIRQVEKLLTKDTPQGEEITALD